MRLLLSSLLVLSWLIGIVAPSQAQGPEIWFPPANPVDWKAMFQPDANWRQAAKQVKILTLTTFYIQTATAIELRAVFDFLSQNHIGLGLELEGIEQISGDSCGTMEGYRSLTEVVNTVNILKRMHVELVAIAVDEPVWFGHYDSGPNACRLAVPDLVNRVATNIQPILAAFPNVRIVEIEPVPAVSNFSNWQDTLKNFQVGLARKLGRQIQGMQLDVDWDRPSWIPAVKAVHAYLRKRNMTLGIYYNGSALDRSDARWIDHAVRNFETVEGTLGIVPDQAIFATWHPYPSHNLPETSPTTQTWLINNYFRKHAMLDVHFVGVGARGRLTTSKGKPIANATIVAYMGSPHDLFKIVR